MISKLKIMSLFFLTCGLVTAINPCVGMDSNTHFGSNSNNTNNIKNTNYQSVQFNNSEQYEMLNDKDLSKVNTNINKNKFNYNINKNKFNYNINKNEFNNNNNIKNKFNINNKYQQIPEINSVNSYGPATVANKGITKYSDYSKNKYNSQNHNNINYYNNINNKINNEEMNNYNNINNKINNKYPTFISPEENNEMNKDFKLLKDRSLERQYINENRINHLQSLTGARKQRYAMNLARNAFFANPDNKNAALRGYRGTTAVGRSTPGASNTSFMEGSRNNNNDSQHKNTKESPK